MFAINELPKLVMRTIWRRPLKRIPLNEQKTDFPNNVIVKQDGKAEHYIDALTKLLVYPITEEIRNNKAFLEWQIKQCYRILNAASASSSPCMKDCRFYLNQLRAEIEGNACIVSWLAQLTNSPLICSGHGGCDPEAGYIKNFHGSEVTMFNPIGTAIGTELSTLIENDRFKKEDIIGYYEKDKISFTFEKYRFPQIYADSLSNKLPNLILSTEADLTARIIESQTLRVLCEFKKEIHLHEVLKMFPRRKLIWLACASIQKKGLDASLGPNAQFMVDSRTPNDKPIAEKQLRRSRKWASKMTYDERFCLFSSNRVGTVNPIIEQQYKRLKKSHDQAG